VKIVFELSLFSPSLALKKPDLQASLADFSVDVKKGAVISDRAT